MATAGKGLPFIGKMNEFLNKVLHPTVQKIGNSRAAMDVIHKGYYILNPVPSIKYIVEAGSTDNLVKLTAHGFKPGDLFRIGVTTNPILEFEITIDEIVDANSFKLAGYLSANLTAGDTFDCLRPVSERFAADGSTLASIATPAVSYNRKAGGITTQTSVLEDLDTPANSRAMPVVLHGVDAASITITSNDLNIASSHVNDSIRLGDGTTLTGVTANNELKVKDIDAQTNFGLIADSVATTDTGSFSLIALTKKLNQSLTAMLTKLSDRSQKTQLTNGTNDVTVKDIANQIVSGDYGLVVNAAIHGLTTAGGGAYVDVKVTPSGAVTVESTSNGLALASESTQVANGVLIGPVTETAPATDTASSGLNGRLQRIAQRLTSMIALLPAALGQGTMAQSLRVVLASDQSTIVVSATATTNLDTNLGAKADAVATTETGTFSLIALIKFLSANLTLMSAKLPASLGIKTSALSLSVTPSSDGVFATKPKALTGTYAENLALTTVATFTAPANAIGAIVQADDQNANSLRAKQGAAATASSGMQLQAGRDMKFDSGTDISVCSESASVKVYVQWFIQS